MNRLRIKTDGKKLLVHSSLHIPIYKGLLTNLFFNAKEFKKFLIVNQKKTIQNNLDDKLFFLYLK